MTKYSISLSASFIGATLLLAFATPVLAGDSATQASAAASHAGYAAKAADIKMAHMHLHHVVNCLVGPEGEGFDTNEANPCAAMGSGAIPDATDPIVKEKLMDALNMANMGLATDDLSKAHKQASQTEMALKPWM